MKKTFIQLGEWSCLPRNCTIKVEKDHPFGTWIRWEFQHIQVAEQKMQLSMILLLHLPPLFINNHPSGQLQLASLLVAKVLALQLPSAPAGMTPNNCRLLMVFYGFLLFSLPDIFVAVCRIQWKTPCLWFENPSTPQWKISTPPSQLTWWKAIIDSSRRHRV